MTENQTRVQPGIPTGGQYTATAHSDAVPSLPSAGYKIHTAELRKTIELRNADFDRLPEWPSSMPEPDVSFSFEGGKCETSITVDDKTMNFWDSDSDGTINDTDNGSNPWEDFDEEDQEMALEWGKRVHQRIDSSTYGIMIEASHQPDVHGIILAHALGKEPAAAKSGPDLTDLATRNAYVIDVAARLAAANKELQKVYMIGAAQELHALCPEIDSFELTADEKGRLELQVAYDADGNPLSGTRIYDAGHQVFHYRQEDDFDTFLEGKIITVAEAINFRPAR